MPEWKVRNRIEYSPNGDDIDRFSLKVRDEFELIYRLLNKLRSFGASPGILADTVAYQFHVDTASGRLLIRDGMNQRWIELGRVDKSFWGITPEDIGAIRNTGTVGAFHLGGISDLPKHAGINDIFFAVDVKKIFCYTGMCWEVLASLDAGDMYESHSCCPPRNGMTTVITKPELMKILAKYVPISSLCEFNVANDEDIMKIFSDLSDEEDEDEYEDADEYEDVVDYEPEKPCRCGERHRVTDRRRNDLHEHRRHERRTRRDVPPIVPPVVPPRPTDLQSSCQCNNRVYFDY